MSRFRRTLAAAVVVVLLALSAAHWPAAGPWLLAVTAAGAVVAMHQERARC